MTREEYISMMGYSDNSPLRNEDSLNIQTGPNGIIDMTNTGIPLMANNRYLPPYSGHHQFAPNSTVTEIPLAQFGQGTSGYVKADPSTLREGSRPNYDEDGNVTDSSTVIMRSEILEDGTWVSFPSLFQNKDGTWVDMSGEEFWDNWQPVYQEAIQRGEVYNWGSDKESALAHAEGSWKTPKSNTQSYFENSQGNAMIEDLTTPEGWDMSKQMLKSQQKHGRELPKAQSGTETEYSLSQQGHHPMDDQFFSSYQDRHYKCGQTDEACTFRPKKTFGYNTGDNSLFASYNPEIEVPLFGTDRLRNPGGLVLAGGVEGRGDLSYDFETNTPSLLTSLTATGRLGLHRYEYRMENQGKINPFTGNRMDYVKPKIEYGIQGGYDLLNKNIGDVGIYGKYGNVDLGLDYNIPNKQVGLNLGLTFKDGGSVPKYQDGIETTIFDNPYEHTAQQELTAKDALGWSDEEAWAFYYANQSHPDYKGMWNPTPDRIRKEVDFKTNDWLWNNVTKPGMEWVNWFAEGVIPTSPEHLVTNVALGVGIGRLFKGKTKYPKTGTSNKVMPITSNIQPTNSGVFTDDVLASSRYMATKYGNHMRMINNSGSKLTPLQQNLVSNEQNILNKMISGTGDDAVISLYRYGPESGGLYTGNTVNPGFYSSNPMSPMFYNKARTSGHNVYKIDVPVKDLPKYYANTNKISAKDDPMGLYNTKGIKTSNQEFLLPTDINSNATQMSFDEYLKMLTEMKLGGSLFEEGGEPSAKEMQRRKLELHNAMTTPSNEKTNLNLSNWRDVKNPDLWNALTIGAGTLLGSAGLRNFSTNRTQNNAITDSYNMYMDQQGGAEAFLENFDNLYCVDGTCPLVQNNLANMVGDHDRPDIEWWMDPDTGQGPINNWTDYYKNTHNVLSDEEIRSQKFNNLLSGGRDALITGGGSYLLNKLMDTNWGQNLQDKIGMNINLGIFKEEGGEMKYGGQPLPKFQDKGQWNPTDPDTPFTYEDLYGEDWENIIEELKAGEQKVYPWQGSSIRNQTSTGKDPTYWNEDGSFKTADQLIMSTNKQFANFKPKKNTTKIVNEDIKQTVGNEADAVIEIGDKSKESADYNWEADLNIDDQYNLYKDWVTKGDDRPLTTMEKHGFTFAQQDFIGEDERGRSLSEVHQPTEWSDEKYQSDLTSMNQGNNTGYTWLPNLSDGEQTVNFIEFVTEGEDRNLTKEEIAVYKALRDNSGEYNTDPTVRSIGGDPIGQSHGILFGDAFGLNPEGSGYLGGGIFNPIMKSMFSKPLEILSTPASLVAEGLESYYGWGDGEFNFTDALPNLGLSAPFTNYKGEEGYKRSSDIIPGMEDAHWLPKFAVDLFTDPLTYLTAGTVGTARSAVRSSADDLLRTTVRSSDDLLRTVGKTKSDDLLKTSIKSSDNLLTTKSDDIVRGVTKNKHGQIKTSFDHKLTTNNAVKDGYTVSTGKIGNLNITYTGTGANQSIRIYTGKSGANFMTATKSKNINGKQAWTLDMAMDSRIDAGKSMLLIQEYIPKNAIVRSSSYSLDSYKLMTNQIKHGKFRYIDDGTKVPLNSLAKQMDNSSVTGSFNKVDAEEYLININKMLDDAGIKTRATMRKDLNWKGDRWKIDVPQLNLQKLFREGGEIYGGSLPGGEKYKAQYLQMKNGGSLPKAQFSISDTYNKVKSGVSNFFGTGPKLTGNDSGLTAEIIEKEMGVGEYANREDPSFNKFMPTWSKEMIFNKFRPGRYPIMSEVWKDFIGKNTESYDNTDIGITNKQPWVDAEGHYTADEKAWRMVLGLPGQESGEGKYILPADYIPSETEYDENLDYYKLASGQMDWQNMLNSINERNAQLYISQGTGNYEHFQEDFDTPLTEQEIADLQRWGPGSQNISIPSYESADLGGVEHMYNYLINPHDAAGPGESGSTIYDPIARFDMDLDVDEEGKHYISYRDVYNFNSKAMNAAIKPFGWYDRQYVDYDETTGLYTLPEGTDITGMSENRVDMNQADLDSWINKNKPVEEVTSEESNLEGELNFKRGGSPHWMRYGREKLLKKKLGGEFLKKIQRLNQQLGVYNEGGKISPLAKRELETLSMIKPKMAEGGQPSIEHHSYVVKKGDNLTRIASDNNMSLSDLLILNPKYADNPSKVYSGDRIAITENATPDDNKATLTYRIKQGDTLADIATKYGVRYIDIARINNIKDPNKIQPNQEIILPDNANTNDPIINKNIDIAESVYTNTSTADIDSNPNVNVPWVKRTFENGKWINSGKRNIKTEINKMDQVDRIIEGMNTIEDGDDKPYIVIDEKKGRMHLYYPGQDKPTKSYPILTGSNEGDAQTVTKPSIFKDGKKLNRDELNTAMEDNNITSYDVDDLLKVDGYTSETDWDAGNKQTGAGIYTIGLINEDSGYYDDSGNDNPTPSFVLNNSNGDEVPNVIHTIPSIEDTDRLESLEDEDGSNNRMTNGCINGRCEDITELYNHPDIGVGTQVYVLPEDAGNNFVFENGVINFYASSDNQTDAQKYIDEYGNEQFGHGIANKTTGNYKPINITFDKNYYQTNSERYDGTAEGEEQEFVNNTQPFLNAIVDNKKDIMTKLGMDGDMYNDLSMIAFGIYGYESGMGDEGSASENLVKAGLKWSGLGDTSPDVKSKYNTYDVTGDNRSVGWTQMRFSDKYRDEPERNAMKKLGIETNDQLMDPANSFKATMAVLYTEYQMQISDEEKANEDFDIFTALPAKYSPTGGEEYVNIVNKYMDYIDLTETDIDDVDNNLIIKGEYSDDNVESNKRMENKPIEEKLLNPTETITHMYNQSDYVKPTVDAGKGVLNSINSFFGGSEDYWKSGGEFSAGNQVQFYNDFINGNYKGTKQENKANKMYDKLNRMYYNDSKKTGKHQLDIMKSILGANRRLNN